MTTKRGPKSTITDAERAHIVKRWGEGAGRCMIAGEMHRKPSTISDEIDRMIAAGKIDQRWTLKGTIEKRTRRNPLAPRDQKATAFEDPAVAGAWLLLDLETWHEKGAGEKADVPSERMVTYRASQDCSYVGSPGAMSVDNL